MFLQKHGQIGNIDELIFFRSIVDEARDIILAIKLDGRICYANQAASVAYGYTLAELYELRIHDLRDPATISDIARQLQESRTKGILFRTVHKRRSGELFPVEVSSRTMSPLPDDIYVSIIRDISEIKHTEEVGQETRQFVDNLLSTANAMVVMLGIDGQIEMINQAAERITGYTLQEVKGLNWFETMIPEGKRQNAWEFSRQQTGANELCSNLENPIRTKSGEIRHIIWQNSKWTNRGHVIGTVSFGIDVTERVRAEAGLRHQEEFVHGIVEGLDIPFFAVDHAFRYFVFNTAHVRAMKQHYGVDIKMGESILSYHTDPKARETVRKNLALALTGQACVVEAFIGDAQWEQKYLRVEHNPIRNSSGFIIGVAVFCSDISEQRKAENEARACDLRYRELVEDTQVIIMALNPSGKIGYINDYGLKFFDYSSTNLLEQSLCELLVPEVDANGRNLWELYESLWLNGSDGFRETHENRTASGKRVWVDWTVRRGVNPLSGEAGWLCIGIDVSAKQRLQETEKRGYERRLRNELMQDIIAGRLTAEQAHQTAKQLRLNLAGPFACIVFAKAFNNQELGGSIQHQQHVDEVIDALRDCVHGIVWEAHEGICVLLPCNGKVDVLTPEEAKNRVISAYKDFYKCGLGKKEIFGASFQFHPSVTIPALYEQALIALEFGPIQKPRDDIHFWHELGWVRLIAKEINSQMSHQYVSDQLGPILQIGPLEKRAVLLSTLRELLSGEMFDTIAKRLNVHPQTIRYRKRVIEKLLNVHFGAKETEANLAIALKLYDVQQLRLHKEVKAMLYD